MSLSACIQPTNCLHAFEKLYCIDEASAKRCEEKYVNGKVAELISSAVSFAERLSFAVFITTVLETVLAIEPHLDVFQLFCSSGAGCSKAG